MDIFWLELLQIYDKQTYDTLSNDPYCLLYLEGDRLKIRGGIMNTATEKEKHKYKGETFWKKETPDIIDKFFGTNHQITKKSICISENFDKYFLLSVSKNKLSFKDLKELFSEGSDADAIVKEWLEKGKYLGSITHHLKNVDVNSLELDNLNKYINAILMLGINITSYKNSYLQVVKILLRKEHYYNEKKVIVHDRVIEWIKEKMKDINLINELSSFLRVLYTTTYYDYHDQEEGSLPLVINNEEIEALLKDAMTLFLNKHPKVTALDIMKEKSDLALMFGNCCVCIENRMATNLGCNYKQIVFDIIINHFQDKRIKPSVNEYDEAIRALFREEVPKFDNYEEECSYLAYMSEEHEQKMQAYFGSSYKSKLKEFKSKCFRTLRKQ